MPRSVVSINCFCGALALLTAGGARSVAAQSGTVQGTISDSAGTAVVGASLSVEGTALRATSGTGGKYVLRGVPRGEQRLLVRAIGSRP